MKGCGDSEAPNCHFNFLFVCLFVLHIDSIMSLIFHGLIIFLKCFLMSSLTEEGL